MRLLQPAPTCTPKCLLHSPPRHLTPQPPQYLSLLWEVFVPRCGSPGHGWSPLRETFSLQIPSLSSYLSWLWMKMKLNTQRCRVGCWLASDSLFVNSCSLHFVTLTKCVTRTGPGVGVSLCTVREGHNLFPEFLVLCCWVVEIGWLTHKSKLSLIECSTL